ncbi:hypothetical protein ACJX0J_018528 [Zea mays]
MTGPAGPGAVVEEKILSMALKWLAHLYTIGMEMKLVSNFLKLEYVNNLSQTDFEHVLHLAGKRDISEINLETKLEGISYSSEVRDTFSPPVVIYNNKNLNLVRIWCQHHYNIYYYNENNSYEHKFFKWMRWKKITSNCLIIHHHADAVPVRYNTSINMSVVK